MNQIPVNYGYNVSVEIIRDILTDTATIKVHAPFYAVKSWILPTSYKSSDFLDLEILRDSSFCEIMRQHYGKAIV